MLEKKTRITISKKKKKKFLLFKSSHMYLKHRGYARATSKHSKSSSLARFVFKTPLSSMKI
jgi:hypothetical protein